MKTKFDPKVLDPEKLLSQGDVDPEEADMIFALFTDTNVKTKLNIFSSSRDIGLIKAVKEWFAAAEKLIDEGKTGMFVSAIHLVHKRNLARKLDDIDTVSFLSASDAFLSRLPSEAANIIKNWQTDAPGPRPTVSKAVEGTYHSRSAEIQRAGFLRRYGLLPYFDLVKFFKTASRLKNKSNLFSNFFEQEVLFELLAYISLDKINVPYVSVKTLGGDDVMLDRDAAKALDAVRQEYWPDILEFLCRDCVGRSESVFYVKDENVFRRKGTEALGMAYNSALNEILKKDSVEDICFFDEIY